MQQFVIGIGSQRAGSTLLHRILSKCTDICMHPIKELHYYDTLFRVRRPRILRVFCMNALNREWDRLIQADSFEFFDARYRCYIRANKMLWAEDVENIDYADLYRHIAEEGRWLGEITPEYMILPDEGVEKMRQDLGAHTKIILLARNPVTRFVSSFKLLRLYGNKPYDMQNFAQDLERAIEEMPAWMDQQDQLSDYAGALARFRRVFDQVLFLPYDRLVTAPESARIELEEFLGKEVNAEIFARLLQRKVNAIGETGEITETARRLLTRRYADSIAHLEMTFGPGACVL